MAEKAVNEFATQLAGAINASIGTIVVDSAAPAGLQSGEFRVRIDNELLLVTSGQNSTLWTVTRGIEGTTAASHSSNADVVHVLTDASLDLLVQGVIDADPRMTDQRTPTDGSVTAAKVNAALKPSGSAAAGDEALRALGSGATQAAAGNDSRLPTAGQKNALAGTSGTPGTGNEYATKQTTDANAAATAAHLADTSAAHAASAISVTPFSSIAATDVQAALAEIVAEAVGGGNASAKFEAVTLGATPALDVASKTIAVFEGTLSANATATTSNRPDGSLIFLLGRQATSGGPYTLSIDGSSVGVPTTAGEYFLVMMVAGDVDTYGGLIGLKLPLAESDVTNLVTDLAAKASTTALAAHEADTTSIHGIADTSVLATATSVATAVSNHEADTTSVHGITNTANLVVNPMTTADDIIKGGASGAPTRVAKGSNNTVWGVDGSGVLGYKADPAGGGGGYPLSVPVAQAHGMVSVAFDPVAVSANQTLTAGQVLLFRLLDFPSTALTTLWTVVGTAGTGGSPANWFGGLYYVSGANLVLAGKTADQVSSWNSPGQKNMTLTAESGQSLTHGGASDQVYVAFLAGTQSTTAVQLGRSAASSSNLNLGLTAGTDPLRAASFGSGLSALPATIAISGLAVATAVWGGVE